MNCWSFCRPNAVFLKITGSDDAKSWKVLAFFAEINFQIFDGFLAQFVVEVYDDHISVKVCGCDELQES